MITQKEERLYGILMPKDWRVRWPEHARVYARTLELSDGGPACIGDPGPCDETTLAVERAEIIAYVNRTRGPS